MDVMLEMILGTVVLLVLLYGCLATAVPLAERMLAGHGPVLRLLGVAMLSSVYLTLVFHVLLSLGAFNRAAASAVLLATIGIVRLAGPTHRELLESIGRDLRPIRRTIGAGRWNHIRAVYVLAAFFALVTIARVLILPTIAWDSLTYHFVKAGMWVQSGGPISMQAPGGWSLYRSIFGGGEIFTAWAMLPFGNDLLACGVDLVWWALSALALYALGGEFGLRVRHRWAGVIYASFVPAVWDSVGWGYVDLANIAFSMTGLVFAIRYLRTRRSPLILFSLLALALASGVKLTSAPLLALTGIVLSSSILLAADDRGRRLGFLCAGSIVGFFVVFPWLLDNFLETGFPLRLPLTIAGIQLGPDSPVFTWYHQREVPAYTLEAEWQALRGLFEMPSVNTHHLSSLSVLPIALTPFGFMRIFRERHEMRSALGLMLGFMFCTLFYFYGPDFSIVRLTFVISNGRFLAPILMLCLVLAFTAFPCTGRWRDVLGGYLVFSVLVHLYYSAPGRLTMPSSTLVLSGTIATIVGLGLALYIARTRLIRPRFAAPILVLAIALALTPFRSPERRYALLANRSELADWFRYWWVAARIVDDIPRPHRIAITGGATQDSDNWLMYYFMGGNLQNTLHYISISTGGEFLPFGPDTKLRDAGDVEAWISRIHESGISHVMSFAPSSVEISWMNAHPERFSWLTGHEDRWALYRVLPGRDRE